MLGLMLSTADVIDKLCVLYCVETCHDDLIKTAHQLVLSETSHLWHKVADIGNVHAHFYLA